MGHLQWTPNLSVGNPTLDGHHQRLIGMINAGLDATETTSQQDVGRILSDLLNYTRYHFTEEEMVMEDAGYPGLEAHRKIHADLSWKVGEMYERYKSDPAAFPAADLFTFLSKWLIEHIGGEDQRYHPYLY